MIFRDAVGYEGLYMITDKGLIASLPRKIKFNHSGKIRTRKSNLKYLKPNVDKDGYQIVRLYKNGIGTYKKVHRIVAETFFGKSNLVVNHKDLNKINNSIENLEFVSIKENNAHARKNIKFNE